MKKTIIFIAALLLALTLNFGFAHFTHSAQTAHAYSWGEFGSDVGDLFGGDDLSEVSFDDFEGGLQVPSAKGYTGELVKATDLREFIVTVVNFALGFLGLVAMIIIIYGGIRYVTSAGESGGVEAGKKSIMYAALGLIVVLASFAIVNTILKAPSGSDTGTGGGALAPTAQTMVFSVEEIKNIPRTIASIYEIYSKNSTDFIALRQAANEIGRYTQFNSPDSMQSAMQTLESGLKNSQNRINEISRRSPKTSIMQERSAQFAIYINSWLMAMNRLVAEVSQSVECKASPQSKCKVKQQIMGPPFAIDAEVESDCKDICKQTISTFSPKFKESVNELLNYLTTGSNTPPAISGTPSTNFMDISYKAFEADNDTMVNETLDKIKKSIKDLSASASYVSEDIKDLFDKIDMDSFKNPSSQNVAELKIKIVKIIETIQELQTKLTNVKFVKVYLTADALEGNVPLIVNFNTAGTVDPSGKTVQDDKIHWDLDGNGNFDEYKNSLGCSEKAENKSSAIATCVYKKTGTYRVAVKVDSSGKEFAGGIAYATIKILPPKARIKLKATIYKGGTDIPVILIDYDQKGFLLVDRPRLTVTLTQAKNGIQFDANGTSSAGVAPTGSTIDTIQRIKWDFGDRTETVEGEPIGPILAPKHFYTQIGEYPVIVEVTDKNGVKDRKIFVVSVSNIAALIDISPVPVGKAQTLFMVSGENSSSENGSITGFEWDVIPDINKLGKIDKSIFSTKFGKPNLYTLTLRVKDNQGNEATDTAEIKVESAAPIAKFSYSTPKSNQPAIIQLDGTKTYDPDGPNKDIIYLWTIEDEEKNYKFVSGDSSSAKPLIKFNEIGTHRITLKASDKNEPDKYTETMMEILITNLLDIEWGAKSTSSVNINPEGEAPASFEAISEHAASYDFDFGDNETESGIPSNGKISASHTYKKAGTYTIKLTVSDDARSKNSITRKIVVGGAKNPAALIKLLINGEEYFETSAPIQINRKDVVTFDASGSINADGTKQNLKYQWDFGDAKKSTKEIAVYTYKELSKLMAPYMATLKVVDAQDPTKFATDTVKIVVVSVKPTLKSIIAIPEAMELKTPLRISLSAIEPVDADGRIISYKWWYFDINNPEEKLGEQITSMPSTVMTVGTKGNEGDTVKYKFSVMLADDENQAMSAEDAIGIESLPMLEVVNGPNKPPIAKFSVNKTNIKVGESITFSSSSSDPDGKIATYIWDTDGEGFAGKEQTQKSTVTVTYNKPAAEGISVKLKVIDDNYAETISDPVVIYVLSKSAPPKAAFTSAQTVGSKTAAFKNNSTADEANGAKIEKYIWDFDTMSTYQTADSDGDSVKDNDADSIEKDPSYEYPAFGTFYAKLTVIDNMGNKTFVVNPVILKSLAGAAPSGGSANMGADTGINLGNVLPGYTDGGASGTQLPETINLKVKTSPVPDSKDGKIHFAGTFGYVEFSFAESTGNIVRIIADKNIYFDSDNNGVLDDDVNFQTQSKLTPWKTDFSAAWGKIAVKITAYDKNNNFDTVVKEIVFDPTTKAGATNIFTAPGDASLYAALASMLGFGIVSVSALRRRKRNR